MKTERRPADHFAPPIPPARTDRVWGNVAARTSSRKHTAARIAMAMAAALMVVIASISLRHGGARQVPLAGLSITAESAPQTLELADGSRLVLEPSTHVTVEPSQPSEQRIAIDRGAVQFQVTHDPARRFVVAAGDVEVIDVGTVFTVAHEGEDGGLVRVSVQSGDVEVRSAGKNARQLHAGESLTTPEKVSATAPEAPPQEAPPAPELSPTADPIAPSARADAVPSAAAKGLEPASAKSLLAEATAAREAGNVAAEAQALETLRKRFPNDPRAPMAAFELGRIRMDQLGDQEGAVKALRAAASSDPSAASREDAEARIVTLLAKTGDAKGCRAARDAFLAHYPASIHRASVRAQCQPP